MSVCVVTSEYSGVNKSGGIGAAVRGFVEVLIYSGYEVDVFITDGSSSLSDAVGYSCHTGRPNFVFIADVAAADKDLFDPVDDISRSYVVYRYLASKTYSVVHFNEWTGSGFYTAMARRQGSFDATVVTHVHGSSQWVRRHNLNSPDLADFEREAIERSQIENSDWVVSPSDYMLQWYRDSGLVLKEARRINWVLPQWTQLLAHGEADGGLKTRAIAPGQIKELIFFGRQERRKGFALFIDAVRRLPPDLQPDLTFLGRFDQTGLESSGSYALRMLSDYGGRIRFVADLDQAQAMKRIQTARSALCVMPSLSENCPCVIGECFSVGVPFLAADVGGVAELIDPGSRPFCLVAPGPAELAVAIVRIVHDGLPELRSTLVPGAIARDWRNWHHGLLADQTTATPRPPCHRPLVSVCLVHYERPVLLKAALAGLMAQSYDRIEIILVDDGSRQPAALACLDAVEAMSHRFPVRVLRSENRYLGAARNLAASHAEGEFLLFHDDDNLAEPDEIARFVEAASRSGCDVLTSQCWVFRSDEGPVPGQRRIEYYPIGIGGVFSFFKNRFGDANALVRRSAFESLGGFTELKGVGWEDWEFLLRAYLRGYKMGVVPDPLFNYRSSARGMLLTGNPQLNEERLYDLIDTERPGLSSDLLRFAKAPQQRAEMLARLEQIFAGLTGGKLHRDLVDLDPNSPAGLQALSDLAFEIGRHADAIEIGLSDHAQRLKLIGLVAQLSQPAGLILSVGGMTIPAADVGTPVTYLQGWAFSQGGQPHSPISLTIDGKRFRTLAQTALHRHDVNTQFGLDAGARVGFVVVVAGQGGKTLPWIRGVRLAASKRSHVHLLDRTRPGFAGYIDDLVGFQIVQLTPPVAGDWHGDLVIETTRPTVVFARVDEGEFRAGSEAPRTKSRFSFQISDIASLTVIIPADGETAILFR